VEGTPITNQRSSGRCWLFAATNTFRVPLINAYQLKELELSQAYLFYWDKIEKANWFFEQIIATANEDLSSRLVQKLCEDPVTDGGQWDMVANLVQKYGLVPHTLYPDPYHAQNSAKMNWLITAKLREQALALRQLATENRHMLATSKEQFLQEIHALVTLLLGPPPSPDKEFVWQYSDSKGKAREVRITPIEFARQALRPRSLSPALQSVSTGRLFSLVHDPRHEFNRLLTIERLGNVVEGRPITYINVEMQTLKTAVIAMLRAGYPVFFGCDVGKFYDRDRGVLDNDLTDLALGFNIPLKMNKAQRVASGESAMTHAMVITGVHLEDKRPARWRVENSWGEEAGDKGWFVMTDRWMDEYTFQAVVDFNFVSADVQAVLEQRPKVLPRWDPMGVLA
jgi:bleomycin hydrolase